MNKSEHGGGGVGGQDRTEIVTRLGTCVCGGGKAGKLHPREPVKFCAKNLWKESGIMPPAAKLNSANKEVI